MLEKSKNIIRRSMLERLRSQKQSMRLKKSQAIKRKLFLTPEFRKAKLILFYASFDGEVETFNMMKQAKRLGKRIALPAILKKKTKFIPVLVENLVADLTDGPFGIKQPLYAKTRAVPLATIDLAVVPGVAFDKKNNRLGRGKGYYDRFLSRLPAKTPLLGLAFDFQVIDRLPIQKNLDIPLTRVIAG